MKFFDLYELIVSLLFFILLFYHIIKHEYQQITSALLLLVLSLLSPLAFSIFHIKIDLFSNIVYLIFIFMSLYLGSTYRFYDKYKWWDRIIHFLSGIAFVGFGVAIANNYSDILKWGILLFSFTFSTTLHVLWEVAEYLSDCKSHGNAQRWQMIHDSTNHQPEKAVQPAGLVDTMNDLICCLIGSCLAVVGWWIFL